MSHLASGGCTELEGSLVTSGHRESNLGTGGVISASHPDKS